MRRVDSGRRDFFKYGVLATVSLLFTRVSFGQAAAAAGGPVPEDDPVAKALGYKKDASKVDTKAFPKRAGAEGKKQFCDNCMFYAAEGPKQGKCQIFQNRLVEAKGWCNSWAVKPAAK